MMRGNVKGVSNILPKFFKQFKEIFKDEIVTYNCK